MAKRRAQTEIIRIGLCSMLFLLLATLSIQSFAEWTDRNKAIAELAKMGLPPNATSEEIKQIYRKLAMKYHPDRTGNDPIAEETFKNIKAAYEYLTHPENIAPEVVSHAQQPQAQAHAPAPSAEWKKRYDIAYDFASRPILKLGMGFDSQVAHDWATEVANKFSSGFAVQAYAIQYETALRFAVQPVSAHGLGLSLAEARNWAIQAANIYPTGEALRSYLQKLSPQSSCYADQLKANLRSSKYQK